MTNTNDIAEKLEGILSEEALKLLLGSEALSDLMEELEDHKETIEDHESFVERSDKKANMQSAKIKDLESKVADFQARVGDLIGREKAVTQNEFTHQLREVRNEFEFRRGEEFKECLHLALRNTSIKTSMYETKTDNKYLTTPPGNNDQGVWVDGKNETTNTDSTNTITTTKEEE